MGADRANSVYVKEQMDITSEADTPILLRAMADSPPLILFTVSLVTKQGKSFKEEEGRAWTCLHSETDTCTRCHAANRTYEKITKEKCDCVGLPPFFLLSGGLRGSVPRWCWAVTEPVT